MVPGKMTKNGKPHTIALEGDLWSLIEHRWQRREVRRNGRPVFLSPFVFHQGDGKALGDIRKRWDKACELAKVRGLLFHDLRRSGVYNMVRGGVDRDVAKSISGHKTDSMFARYNIIDEKDQRERFVVSTSTAPTTAREQRRKNEVRNNSGDPEFAGTAGDPDRHPRGTSPFA
jgi:integrase